MLAIEYSYTVIATDIRTTAGVVYNTYIHNNAHITLTHAYTPFTNNLLWSDGDRDAAIC